MEIKFINHASLLVSTNKFHVLSDPWFYGAVFNNGWNLMCETKEIEIKKLLNKVNYIWLSHEHPDHFSVPFFKKYNQNIIDNGIKILFQFTEDKRVKKFLNHINIEVVEIEFNKKIEIEKNVNIVVYKHGFYDSALLIQDQKNTFLNLNDCPITKAEMLKINKTFPLIDYVATQFSYAAWKGGKNNKQWRIDAALEKIQIIHSIKSILKPKNIILFASFSYFSRLCNNYLNDCWNSPKKIIDQLSDIKTRIIVGVPLGKLNNISDKNVIRNAHFWDSRHNEIMKSTKFDKLVTYDIKKIEEVCNKAFIRLKNNNNYLLLKMLKLISFNYVCGSINFYITDLNINFNFDLINGTLKRTNSIKADINLLSTDFVFLHEYDYGFDTLTVNGCFEEENVNGFKRLVLSYSLFSLNNTGISFDFKIFFNIVIIKKFIELFLKVLVKKQVQL
jgi:UDP-MurNAc hydroxylase